MAATVLLRLFYFIIVGSRFWHYTLEYVNSYWCGNTRTIIHYKAPVCRCLSVGRRGGEWLVYAFFSTTTAVPYASTSVMPLITSLAS